MVRLAQIDGCAKHQYSLSHSRSYQSLKVDKMIQKASQTLGILWCTLSRFPRPKTVKDSTSDIREFKFRICHRIVWKPSSITATKLPAATLNNFKEQLLGFICVLRLSQKILSVTQHHPHPASLGLASQQAINSHQQLL